jgi:hypothetical protein
MCGDPHMAGTLWMPGSGLMTHRPDSQVIFPPWRWQRELALLPHFTKVALRVKKVIRPPRNHKEWSIRFGWGYWGCRQGSGLLSSPLSHQVPFLSQGLGNIKARSIFQSSSDGISQSKEGTTSPMPLPSGRSPEVPDDTWKHFWVPSCPKLVSTPSAAH